MQRNISAECCDKDDLEGEMFYPDELEVDTNIYEVQFACLKNDATLMTDDLAQFSDNSD